jgi:hypothetical protein
VVNPLTLGHTAAVTLPSPSGHPVQGYAGATLQSALAWYLEDYLEFPKYEFQKRAEAIQSALRTWGQTCFDALFQGRAAWGWYLDARNERLENLQLVITSDDPHILSWPWEALHSRDDGGYLAQRCHIARQLPGLLALPNPKERPPQDQINILYIVARPTDEQYISYNALARPLVDFVRAENLPVQVDVLRPPTFDTLRAFLHARPSHYHILHFDGHGAAQPQGTLVFEKEDGSAALITSTELRQTLAEYNIPLFILNACQSAAMDARGGDPFASVAASLLQANVRGVVAMSHSLYAEAARQFVPEFYRSLLMGANPGEALRAGRAKMFLHPERPCYAGEVPLQDWIVPIHYLRPGAQDGLVPTLAPNEELPPSNLPGNLPREGDYGFFGRDRELLDLERAL